MIPVTAALEPPTDPAPLTRDGLHGLLDALIGDSPALLAFAEAVVIHLSGPTRAPDPAIVRDVVEILHAVQDPERELPVTPLARRPDILASFFQNADLLPPDAVETGDIARLVMLAMEQAQDPDR